MTQCTTLCQNVVCASRLSDTMLHTLLKCRMCLLFEWHDAPHSVWMSYVPLVWVTQCTTLCQNVVCATHLSDTIHHTLSEWRICLSFEWHNAPHSVRMSYVPLVWVTQCSTLCQNVVCATHLSDTMLHTLSECRMCHLFEWHNAPHSVRMLYVPLFWVTQCTTLCQNVVCATRLSDIMHHTLSECCMCHSFEWHNAHTLSECRMCHSFEWHNAPHCVRMSYVPLIWVTQCTTLCQNVVCATHLSDTMHHTLSECCMCHSFEWHTVPHSVRMSYMPLVWVTQCTTLCHNVVCATHLSDTAHQTLSKCRMCHLFEWHNAPHSVKMSFMPLV